MGSVELTPGLLLAVAAGGFLGAASRFLLDGYVTSRVASRLPWGTLAINVSGALLLGLLTGLSTVGVLPVAAGAGLGDGFCGAFTTFSTFSFETLRLAESGRYAYAAANLGASVALGLAAAAAGIALGHLAR